MKKKILLIGGTGAMGVYLAPELLNMGYAVDVVSFDTVISDNPDLRYFKFDAMNDELLFEQLKQGYTAIVDFMLYANVSTTFKPRMERLLNSTDHYFFLSTYRIYGNEEHPVKETSPRLLDLIGKAEYLIGDTDYETAIETEYSLYKSMGENYLRGSDHKNWTILRPAITYSKRRFQLVTLEASVVIERMRNKKTLVLPETAMSVRATMSWAGDVAKMIARLVLNPQAYRETFTVATAEHHSWQEVAEMYKKIDGLSYITVDTETYLNVWSTGSNAARWQLYYDRYFDRIMDNTKILNVTGMKQSELMPLYEGLKREYSALPKDYVWPKNLTNDRMDEFLKNYK